MYLQWNNSQPNAGFKEVYVPTVCILTSTSNIAGLECKCTVIYEAYEFYSNCGSPSKYSDYKSRCISNL